jgi:hypothetical protein
VLRKLNRAAGWAGEGMPRHIRKHDAINHAYAKQFYVQIAAAMRTWGVLAATPSPTSRQQLIDKLTGAVAQIAVGDWEAMERLDPADRPGATAKLQRAERVRQRLRRVTVAAATLILMGLLLGSYSAAGAWLAPYRPVVTVVIPALLIGFSSIPVSDQIAKLVELFTKTTR